MIEQNKAIAKAANELVLKERNEQIEKEKADLIQLVKSAIANTLQAIDDKKSEKEKLEEELRILKADLDDLRAGKFDKIVERQDKSNTAKEVGIPDAQLILNQWIRITVNPEPKSPYGTTTWPPPVYWNSGWTDGTYTTSNKVYYF